MRVPASSPSGGFSENMAGHITWQRDGQTDMLVNPWGLWWQELTASDICVVDEDAQRGLAAAGTSRPPSTSTPSCTGCAPTPGW